jgi:Domain of unknown function (DUF4838)
MNEETLKLAHAEFETLSSAAGMANLNAEFELSETVGYSLCHEAGILKFSAPSAIELLYAVYDFAETFMGYCFFEPGVDLKSEIKEEIPAGTLFKQKCPKLKRRGFIQEFPFNADSLLVADWMAKNRLNYVLVWMKYYDLISDELKEYFVVRGIEIESGHHNFSYWIPTSEYGENSPDFFAMKDGVRIKPSEDKNALLLSEQLCTTNPELRTEMAKKMIAYAKCHPEIKTLSIAPNDGFGWCECPECSKYYDPDDMGDFYCVSEHTYRAGHIYHEMFTNVVRQFNAQCPDVDVTLMAYVNYSRPSPGFKLKSGMAVHFAPYWRCINHSMADEACPVNRLYQRDLLEWCACRDGGEVNIYEYFMGVNFYLSLPMIHHELIFDEIDFYSRNKVEGLTTQFHLSHWGVYGINYYAMAQAGYSADKQQFTAKIFNALFGKHTAQYREFYAALRSLQESAGKCLLPYQRHLFRRTETAQFEELLELSGKLPEDIPYPAMCERLRIWAQYLLKYKNISDSAHNRTLSLNELELFLQWCHSQKNKGIIVLSRLDMYFATLADCLKNGKEWIHFNIDWEDDHIKRVDEYLYQIAF